MRLYRWKGARAPTHWNTALLWFAVGTILAGCRHSGTEPKDYFATVVGTYSLIKVDGGPLPAVVRSDATAQTEVISGSVTLRSDRSFERTTLLRHVSAGAPSTTEVGADRGTFVLVGAKIVFNIPIGTRQTGASNTGALIGSTITATFSEHLYRYEKD